MKRHERTISIHAPTRGATAGWNACVDKMIISIHAPTRGATEDTARLYLTGVNFNPRSHKGSDRHDGSFCCFAGISIHAPTRGATPERPAQPYRDPGFQSTLPQGERHPGGICGLYVKIDFNPRSHKGSDDEAVALKNRYAAISIHAPTRGATAILHKIPYLFYFIFTNPFPISYFHTQPASDF